MLKFFKAGIEYNNLAKAMNGMNIMLQEMLPKIAASNDPENEYAEEVLSLAFMARRGVYDRLEQHNWPVTTSISVPTIDRGQITLAYAFQQTVGKLNLLAAELNLLDEVEEILEKGPLYHKLDSVLPEYAKKNI